MSTNFARAHAEHKQLLYNIKTTVETLFLNAKYSSTESWVPTEGLLRLHTCIEQIFTNGIRVLKPDKSPDLWHFIEGLTWINPLMTISIASKTTSPSIHIPYARIRTDRALSWIYENLLTKKLSQKINYLTSDAEHLSCCYEITAFLHNQNYLEAFLICLQAIERNQQNLLSQIDSDLYKNNRLQQHKRSTSHPDFSYLPKVKIGYADSPTQSAMGNKSSIQFSYESDSCRSSYFDLTDGIRDNSDQHPMDPTMFPPQRAVRHKAYSKTRRKKCKQKQFISLKLRPWSSLPDVQEASLGHRSRSKTISQPVSIPFQKVRLTPEILALNNRQKLPAYKQQFLSDSGSSSGAPGEGTSSQQSGTGGGVNDLTAITLVKCEDIKIHLDRKFTPKQTGAEFASSFLSSVSISILDTSIESTSNKTTKDSCTSSPKKSISPVGFFSFLPSGKNREVSPMLGNPEKIDSLYASLLSGSAPGDFVNTFLPKQGEKIQRKHYEKSIMDIGSRDPSPDYAQQSGNEEQERRNRSPYQPHGPVIGQSLTSFLQTGQFSRAHSELERENAHFSVSEAMISAIEQIKWRNLEKIRAKRILEIERLRTGVKKKTRHGSLTTWDADNKHQNFGLSLSSSESSIVSNFSATTGSSTDGNDDDNESDYLHGLSVSTHSINDHTAYAEWGDSNLDTLSAESVALSLISKFSDKQLPRASDLLWLVSEQDVPQKMLPMPGSWAINPDEVYKIPFTRGTRDWAPPRAQIIFTRHPPIDRKKQLHNQNQRCAGCGMKVALAYSHRFRYCEYLGKFFCTGCHRNHISTIPARVLDKWNFTCYPVSVFSYRLLDQIWTFPLFRVSDLNKILYTKIRPLQLAKLKRQQLKYIRDFIMSCRFSEGLRPLFDNIPNYVTNDPDIWSMTDFVRVKNGSFIKDLNALILKCEDEHVFNCELCTARGFICELCSRKQVIFPWQSKIKRCDNCGVCVHDRCWTEDCAKCQRLRKRQQQSIDSSTRRM